MMAVRAERGGMHVKTSLRGKTAIITGGSRGIGLAVAERLVEAGARVVITARKQGALEQAVDRLGGPGVALAVAGKADDIDHQAETVRRAIERFGSVDLLVNNTGINPWFGPMVELDLAVARKILDVNCIAALSWVQHVHRAWMKEHGGAIVNISSHSAIRPAQGVGFYGASKAMLVAMTELLAVELAPGAEKLTPSRPPWCGPNSRRRSTSVEKRQRLRATRCGDWAEPEQTSAARLPSCCPVKPRGSPVRP